MNTLEVPELTSLKVGKALPIAIWHRGDLIAYYSSSEQERSDWNIYAQREANIFSNKLAANESIGQYTGVDRDGKITNWCPPLYFPEWLEERNMALHSLHSNSGGGK